LSYTSLETQVFIGEGISIDGYDPTFEVINLTSELDYKCPLGQIPTSVKDIFAAGVYNHQLVICGKSHTSILYIKT